MSGRPVRLVFVAFAASALLIVLQTVVFQLLAWDSSASASVSIALRVAFVLADAILLASFVTLARAAPAERGLLAVGAALAGFAVVSGLLGLGAKVLGGGARHLLAMAGTASGAEPVMSLGTALLAALVVGALAKPHGSKATARASLVTGAVAVSVALSLGFRLVRLFDPGQRSLQAAWASWIVEVTRPALLAWLAFSLARAMARPVKAEALPVGPYRAAGDGPAAPPANEPLDTATIEALRKVARGLSAYRTRFVVRVAASVVTTFFAVVAMSIRHSTTAVVTVASLVPLVSLATGVPLVLGLVKLLALPRGLRARGVTVGAIVAFGFAALLDAGTLVFIVVAFADSSSYRAKRDIIGLVTAAWPLVAFASGVSLLFVASALRRLGEKLADEHTVRRARWLQGLAIGAGAAQLGALFAGVSSSSMPGALVVVALAIAALGSTIAVIILHLLLVGTARASIERDAPEVPRAG